MGYEQDVEVGKSFRVNRGDSQVVVEGGWIDWREDVAGDCGRVGNSCCFEFDSCLGCDRI